jgi:Zn-dependent protease
VGVWKTREKDLMPQYQQQLQEIAGNALRLEGVNPPAAAMIWRRALDLLPPNSSQYQQVQQRIGALASGWTPLRNPAVEPTRSASTPGEQEIPPHALDYQDARNVRPPDPLPLALVKTISSMALSVVAYYIIAFRNLPIAIGFVVLMLIHEMGHVLAMRYYGLSASPPIFIPFVGALINLRENPANALVESVIGIGGPLLGTIGALVCYGLSLGTHGDLQMELEFSAYLAILLNLFNLLPVPPLDGGRVTAAISPWLWIAGLAGLGIFMLNELRSSNPFGLIIPVLILLYALPRIRATLRARGMKVPYYDIPRAASWGMGAVYLGLGIILVVMFEHLGGMAQLQKLGG